jgi:hypothetical protein
MHLTKSTISKRKLMRIRYKIFIKSELHKTVKNFENLLMAIIDEIIEIK